MAKRLTSYECEVIVQEMFEQWCMTWCDCLEYYDQFPSQERLDEMHITDSSSRKRTADALVEFMEEFNELLIEKQLAEIVLVQGFGSIAIKGDYASMFATPNRI